jgi:hypothetical protein
VHQFIPAMDSENSRPLDIIGFFISGIGLAGIMLGTEMIGAAQGDYTKPAATIVASFALMAISIWHSKRIKYPLIDYSILKVKTFRVTVYSGSITRMVINVAPFILPLMLQFHGTSVLRGSRLDHRVDRPDVEGRTNDCRS